MGTVSSGPPTRIFPPAERNGHVNQVTKPVRDDLCLEAPVALSSAHLLSLTIASDEWRRNAACRDTDPDLFFPVGTTGPAIEQIDNAKAVCRQCDAQADCLEFALATNQDSGIWGGTSEEERRKLRKQYAARQRRTA